MGWPQAPERALGSYTEPQELAFFSRLLGTELLRAVARADVTGGRRDGETSSYTKWDRSAYIERVGGEQEPERRRKALVARQSEYQLPEET